MKTNILFSVLSYYTSIIHTEHMNIGILFQNLETNEVRFEITKNWNRVASFVDDLDIDMFKVLIGGIREETHMYNLADNKNFNMKEFIQYYINELKFSSISSVYDEDFHVFIENTKKMYLTYDYFIKDRPNKDEQLKYFRQIIKGRDINYTSKKPKGIYNENLAFDYIINETHAIKFFNFKDKELKRCINSAKVWALNAQDMYYKYKCVFIYNVLEDELSEEGKKDLNIILSILARNNTDLYSVDKGIEFINSISNNLFDIIK